MFEDICAALNVRWLTKSQSKCVNLQTNFQVFQNLYLQSELEVSACILKLSNYKNLL